MPLHSILVLSSCQTRMQHSVVLAKYYDACTRKYQMDFESSILSNAEVYLNKQVDTLCSITTDANIHVVFQRLGSIILFVSGTEEMDEIVLSDVIEAVRNIILSLVPRSGLPDIDLKPDAAGEKHHDYTGTKSTHPTEHDILNAAVYGMLSLSIDEMISSGGIVDCLEVEEVMRAAKLKV